MFKDSVSTLQFDPYPLDVAVCESFSSIDIDLLKEVSHLSKTR